MVEQSEGSRVGRTRERSNHRNVNEIPSVKFEVAIGFWSRNHAWKFHVAPDRIVLGGEVGMLSVSIAASNAPALPELPTWYRTSTSGGRGGARSAGEVKSNGAGTLSP